MSRNAVLVLAASGLSVGTFVGFRMIVRSEVERVLKEDYRYDQTILGDPRIASVSQLLNLPTSTELAESLTPVWSLTMPEAAIADILEKERQSAFWPAARKEIPAYLKPVDKILFAALRVQAEQAKQLESK